ncbi:s-adenosyl-l-methionine--l-methionine S-methyltransferase [Rhodobacter sp. TJ_12]|uniref:methyltransferase domain-containing protein n=1 Tax=Rhodobacter sp. TJ_12 TaxID=2029399 RepID=UPI001CBB78B6|nr:methyltransferase domain-containing protein [Rhodobacter sp. TJ_12]MBZ4023126.1 s-adenosyl-l-methionine--l-methionine S-methyltransferase [Rhodobacter sp. TJ_12]
MSHSDLTAPQIDELESDATPHAPEFAFDPSDPWTQTFQRALEKADLAGKRVYEVGIGTGANAAFLLRLCGAARVSGSDLDPRMADLAERNVQSLAPEQAHLFHPVHGAVSLIDTPEAQEEIAQTDAVIGCLPQVACPGDPRFDAFRKLHRTELGEGADVREDDHIAHYYPWTEFEEFPFNAVGLGLNEALLRRLRARAPKADVILNFGARVGVPVLFDMFEANGYTPEKLQGQIVRQHAGTDISFFVALEKALGGTGLDHDFRCAFYRDPAGAEPISASEAQQMLDADREAAIYHEVCTIRGRPV